MQLPNIREMFVPDPGYIIADVDLDRADAQVVAWEADDATLKRALKLGADTHLLNAFTLAEKEEPPLEFLVPGHQEYKIIKSDMAAARQFAKNWCHGTNYGGSARTMARAAHCTVAASERAQILYFRKYPGIKEWHQRVERSLYSTRTVSNKLGYRRIYFDRVEGLLPQALAWIPQSTVGLVINEAWEALDRELPEVEILLQVHDSLVMQFKRIDYPDILPEIHKRMQVTVPYDDPLIIPSGIKLSQHSWGACKEHSWDPAERWASI